MHSDNVTGEIDSAVKRFIAGLECRLNKATEVSIKSNCVSMEDQNSKKKSMDIDVSEFIFRFTTDLIYSCFYKQDNLVDYMAQQDQHSMEVRVNLDEIDHPAFELTMTLPLLRPIVKFFIEHFHSYGKMKAKVIEFIKLQSALNLEARREMSRAQREGKEVNKESFKLSDGRVFKQNMADGLIDSFHEGKLTRQEYIHTSYFFLEAGISTLATVMPELLYQLARHPEVQDKLRESIMTAGIESEYLGWCMNEILRLRSGITVVFRETKRDLEVDGGVIPKGTNIIFPIYTIHRMPEYWGEDADQFKPERWEHADKFHPAQYMPFGGGRRVCPGKEVALSTMRRLTQEILLRYKVERCAMTSDSPLWTSPLFILTKQENPVVLKVSKLEA